MNRSAFQPAPAVALGGVGRELSGIGSVGGVGGAPFPSSAAAAAIFARSGRFLPVVAVFLPVVAIATAARVFFACGGFRARWPRLVWGAGRGGLDTPRARWLRSRGVPRRGGCWVVGCS